MTRQEENILKSLVDEEPRLFLTDSSARSAALSGERSARHLCANGKPVLKIIDGRVYNLDGTPATTIC